MLQFGFSNFEEIKNYAGTSELEYDIVLLDTDSNEAFAEFQMYGAEKNFFVTAFDSYSLKKGLEVIGKIDEEVLMTKVLFSRDMTSEEDDYLNFLSFYFSIKWADEKIYFPYDNGSNTVIMNNQRISQIRFRDLDPTYKEGLMFIANLILPDIKNSDLKKAFKRIL